MGQLVTLPLRLTVRTASLFLRGSEEVIKRALALTGRTVEAEPRYDGARNAESPSNGGEPPSHAEAAPAAPSRPRTPDAPAAPRREPRSDPPAREETGTDAASSPATPLVEQPTHVSEEPTLIEEFAEPGAEDGAGAEVRIDEPWPGYRQLKAKDVIARLAESDSAELAAVSLYESANQARQTVQSAVERQLKLAARGGSST